MAVEFGAKLYLKDNMYATCLLYTSDAADD